MMRNVVVQDRTCSEVLFYKRYKITGYKMLLKLGPFGLEGWESNFVGFNLLGFFFLRFTLVHRKGKGILHRTAFL